ncbi:YdiK family protein [Bacillus sp. FJAT-49732]|uniref:YdiK family protein n=1 Tax=Lederbergia citrisecunda TaxID=2833583 RepID=A0A942TRC7_9BACI|nr:YdiK family protein [Lederbergia citrisecunda]MBS4202330.1 YdiK family protein [Lederbergia citrisecunda]
MRSPFFSGVVYLVLGCIFTFFAIQQVTMNDWNFFVYLLLILATFDFGAGFRLIGLHFRIKKQKNKK